MTRWKVARKGKVERVGWGVTGRRSGAESAAHGVCGAGQACLAHFVSSMCGGILARGGRVWGAFNTLVWWGRAGVSAGGNRCALALKSYPAAWTALVWMVVWACMDACIGWMHACTTKASSWIPTWDIHGRPESGHALGAIAVLIMHGAAQRCCMVHMCGVHAACMVRGVPKMAQSISNSVPRCACT